MQCQFLTKRGNGISSSDVCVHFLLRRMRTCLVKALRIRGVHPVSLHTDRECSASVGFDSNVRLYLYNGIGNIYWLVQTVLAKIKSNGNCSSKQV